MDNKRVLGLLAVIKEKYQSMDEPNYAFVLKAVSSRPYDILINKLRAMFEIEEITDENDDVSFRLLLSKEESQWIVELSMIGLFATVFRVLKEGGLESILLKSLSHNEKKIISLLNEAGFEILMQMDLEQPIELKLSNTERENTCIYQALFSDTDILPWKVQGEDDLWRR